jgi:hypothetical protein
VQKTLLNNLRFKRGRHENNGSDSRFSKHNHVRNYSEGFIRETLITNIRTRLLAIAIFLFYFIENGTLGLIPQKFYMVYRNVRLSDIILYGLVIYSLINYKEYRDLFKSKSFLIAKLILAYLLFEFVVSAIRYGFNPVEYFFRLKGVWTSFLVFPYLLLIKRNGINFLIKIIFPVAIISNLLYVLTALTGIPFLPDVSIFKQRLPGDIEVFRVYGGTFFGELFYLGFVYYWITRKFRWWQMVLVILFIIPHILAFGRSAWAGFAFTILLMIVFNSLKKKNFKILFRQAFILVALGLFLFVSFIKFIPESDFYLDALEARLFQGQDDYKYSEGTYGTRILTQNASLLDLWSKNDLFLGIGMHPLWVVGPETKEELIYYGAFCDVVWPSILAAYGLIGFLLYGYLQIYYIYLSIKILKRAPNENLYTLLVMLLLAKLIFDLTFTSSYVLFSTGLWGFFLAMNIYIPVLVYSYEEQKKQGLIT